MELNELNELNLKPGSSVMFLYFKKLRAVDGFEYYKNDKNTNNTNDEYSLFTGKTLSTITHTFDTPDFTKIDCTEFSEKEQHTEYTEYTEGRKEFISFLSFTACLAMTKTKDDGSMLERYEYFVDYSNNDFSDSNRESIVNDVCLDNPELKQIGAVKSRKNKGGIDNVPVFMLWSDIELINILFIDFKLNKFRKKVEDVLGTMLKRHNIVFSFDK